MNLFENLRKFLTAVLSVVSRGPTNGEHNVTSFASGINMPIGNSTVEDNLVQVDPFQKPPQEECSPFCSDEKHPVPDDVQIGVLMNNMQLLKTFYQMKKLESDTITTRITAVLRDGDQFTPLCKSTKRSYKPKAAKDVHGVKHFLLNPDGGDYQQLVQTEHCESYGDPCPALEPYSPPGQRSVCRTHYFRRGLTAINTSSLEPYEIIVRIPSGCNCFVQHSISTDYSKANP